jgi:hydroxyacylglutathione hydrolase
MFIKQLYTGCLSEATYYIDSNGEAAVIDPLRDIDQYLELAKERNATIKYIFETHFHADFVSGYLDLAKKTNAQIVFGPNTQTKLPVHIAKDGEVFSLGNITIETLHTPGHTIESSCYLLKDSTLKPIAIFTGDTLFVGDVGRPDLSSGDMSKEELASIMYDSIQNRILTLADDIIVYPGHCAGSSCGKNLGPENHSTIGEQKISNYALQPQSREKFIEQVLAELEIAPKYFAINAKINQNGYEALDELKSKALTPLSINRFKEMMTKDAVILDTRPAATFCDGYIPGSIFIGLEGRFAEWAGNILPYDKHFILVTEPGKEDESVTRLARVGFNKIDGYLDGGFEAWKNAGENKDMIISIEADELAMDMPFDDKLQIIDVRKESEFDEGHIVDAINLPLQEMTDIAAVANFEETQNLYIHCAGGYRSVIASSIFKMHGLHNLRNIIGGWNKIKEEPKIKIKKAEKNKAVSIKK